MLGLYFLMKGSVSHNSCARLDAAFLFPNGFIDLGMAFCFVGGAVRVAPGMHGVRRCTQQTAPG